MLTAALGLGGVLVGAFVSQRLSASWQRRRERLEALVALAAASARVIGAHERLYDLIAHGTSAAAVEQIQTQRALIERAEAHAEWRTAHARAAILIPRNEPLHAAMSAFGRARAAAIVWILDYQRLGPSFSIAGYKESAQESWQAMRQARFDLIVAGQAIALEDERWLPVLRKRRRERAYHQLAALDAARNRAADAAPDDPPSMSG
jgi:hypothetical protein